jgi:hypothetical protein
MLFLDEKILFLERPSLDILLERPPRIPNLLKDIPRNTREVSFQIF